MRKYLSVKDVIFIQEFIIKEFGGIQGIRDMKTLESAVIRPQTGYYKNIIEEASALMESLAMNHSFIDGNKRISFFAADVFLRMNGYYISCETKEAHKFYISNLENNTFKFDIIHSWLKKKVLKLK
ncbi:MAG: type II toxin-antitoxin system death-on-curing family toxin [Ignavibacteriales bacterium]|nr:type II toxin-antitoxin system death-on-curing family toxin [Ignavibacteriales bacterium]MCB9220000.1 type II toxin-antitoxin system death-on-curing family toxin [Ignavibacteriales bacterium]